MTWFHRLGWRLAIGLVLIASFRIGEGLGSPRISWSWRNAGTARGQEPVVVEPRTPQRGFTAIRAEGAMHLRIRGGADPALSVTAPRDLQSRIITRVEDQELKISMPGASAVEPPPTVSVAGPGIRSLVVSGAVEVQAEGLEGDQVDIQARGASRVVVHGVARTWLVTAVGTSTIEARQVSATRIEGRAEGASRLTFAGTCQDARLWATGASTVQAGRLVATQARLSALGASSIRLGKAEFLEQHAVGASSIRIEQE